MGNQLRSSCHIYLQKIQNCEQQAKHTGRCMQFCSHGAFKVYSKTSSLQFTNTQMTEKGLILQQFFKR